MSGYFVPGVREIPEAVFDAILERAAEDVKLRKRREPAGSDPPTLSHSGARHSFYASSEVAQAVEVVSRRAARSYLLEHHPDAWIEDKPTNHPGFDLETDIETLQYIEVKGTQATFPRFLISEGERRFGSANQHEYLLIAVFGISLEHGSFEGIATTRAPIDERHELTPTQWSAVVPSKPGQTHGSYRDDQS